MQTKSLVPQETDNNDTISSTHFVAPGLSAFHALVLDSMSEGVSVSTEDGVIIYTNPAEDAMFGYDRGELLGTHVKGLNAYEPLENERIVTDVIGCLHQQGVWEGEWYNRRRDGTVFFTQSRITALHDNDKRYWVCVQRDISEDKQKRRELAAAKEHLGVLLESVAEYVISYDNELQVTFVSTRAAQFIGLPTHQILGKTHKELFPHYADSTYAQALKKAITTQENAVIQNFYPETQQWFEIHIFPSSAGVMALTTDITRHKRLEVRAAETEARMHLALRAGKMGGWYWDLKTGSGSWLHGMTELHGLSNSVDNLPMERYLDFVHPEDRPMLTRAVETALATKNDYSIEYRVIWPDGSVHWIESHAALFIGDGAAVEKVAGVCIDVTERVRKEQDLEFLAKASEELAEFVDHQRTLDKVAQLAVPIFADWCSVDLLTTPETLTRVAVAHIDPDKVALAHQLNSQYPPAKESPNGPWETIRTHKPILVPEITPAMYDESDLDPEYKEILRSLGLTSYICVPLIAHGRPLGVLTFVAAESQRNYTNDDLILAEDLARRAAIAIENAELYSALKDSDRRKDIFLATLAHELRNPLAPIINGLEIIKLAPGDVQRVASSVRVIERQTRQLTRLVEDLLDISRISAGKIVLQKERTTLANVINAAVETSQPLVEAAGHSLSIGLPGVPTDIICDPVRLSQVFSNLLSNAARYTPQGGEIHVGVETLPDEFIVRVQDNGIGIPSTMLDKVFIMFAQAEHPINRRNSGLGVGLSLVEGLVRLHGGSVSAHSAGAGKGSEFVVRLPRPPLDTSTDGSKSELSHLVIREEARRILLVDDNVDAAVSLGQILEILGHQVTLVHNGQAAIEAFLCVRPDLVLLDLGLPDISGYEVARHIRVCKDAPQPMLIALTGWGQERDRALTVQAGIDYHMVKPVNINELVDAIAKLPTAE